MSSKKRSFLCISVHVVSEHTAGSHLHFYPDAWSGCAAQDESFAVKAGEMPFSKSYCSNKKNWKCKHQGSNYLRSILGSSTLFLLFFFLFYCIHFIQFSGLLCVFKLNINSNLERSYLKNNQVTHFLLV